ncbi:MAG TPA: hypothetical protein VFP35_03285 [Candidatus Saccharimonadales bacterium]|nr:hypothetical protein [Candidatus Saccharimonadales bacterium]
MTEVKTEAQPVPLAGTGDIFFAVVAVLAAFGGTVYGLVRFFSWLA